MGALESRSWLDPSALNGPAAGIISPPEATNAVHFFATTATGGIFANSWIEVFSRFHVHLHGHVLMDSTYHLILELREASGWNAMRFWNWAGEREVASEGVIATIC